MAVKPCAWRCYLLRRRVGDFLLQHSLEDRAEEQTQLSISEGALQELSEQKQLRADVEIITALFVLPAS